MRKLYLNDLSLNRISEADTTSGAFHMSSSARHLIFFGLACSALAIAISPLRADAAAVGQVIDFEIHQQYEAIRPLGMGNAFVGLADDYNALLYNPAGLARLGEGQMNMGITAVLDSKVVKLKNDLDAASKSGNTADLVALIDSNRGNYYGARAGLGAVWARPKWAIAIIPLDLSLNMAIHALGGASLDLVAFQDTTIAFGRGWDVNWFKQDRMSLGFTGKAIYRGYYNRSFQAADLIFNSNLLRPEDATEGLTVDGDFGSLWTPKVSSTSWMRFIRPSVGFTVRNIADYGFTSNMHLIDKNSGQAPKLGRRYDVGTAWELPDFWIFKTRAVADLRDMGAQNFTVKKGTHMGAEFLWKIRSWWQGGWRVGLNQGYFTAGFTGTLGIFNLDLSTFAEEMGSSETPTASRRYALKASLDF
jgi:hypothetical protein